LGQLKDNFQNWETGKKDGVSTSISRDSFVYFTIGKGILTETYFPSPDTITLHSLRFFINSQIDESQFPYETKIEDSDSPLYKIISSADDLIIEKEFVPGSEASFLYIKYDFSKKTSGSFKIFPFIEKVISVEKHQVLIKAENSYIMFLTDFNFAFEQVGGFFLLHCKNLKNALIKILFGKTEDELLEGLRQSRDFESSKQFFNDSWTSFINLLEVTGKSFLYKRSLINLKVMEDKKHSGAVVASLALPWGSKFPLTEKNGYHLVWVRDIFFVSLAFFSAGENHFPSKSLDYMLNYLMRSNGSFKQNATILGEERWDATQMDQVAFPIILSYKIRRDDIIKRLSLSAECIFNHGPETEQERWEEIGGFSPYSMSLQARALELYSNVTHQEHYSNQAKVYKRLISQKTLSLEGIFGEMYFVRISKGNPDEREKTIELKGKHFAPIEMISTDFLYTVFTGIYPSFDMRVNKSVEVVDKLIRFETPKGISFYRYNGDIYGFDEGTPKGRLWVILTAERGIFEYMKGNYIEAERCLLSVENFSTNTYLLPEQVFEDGSPTESATPLAWSHASYIILYDILFHNKAVSFKEPLL